MLVDLDLFMVRGHFRIFYSRNLNKREYIVGDSAQPSTLLIIPAYKKFGSQVKLFTGQNFLMAYYRLYVQKLRILLVSGFESNYKVSESSCSLALFAASCNLAVFSSLLYISFVLEELQHYSDLRLL
jgi:hypothetical protein